MSSRFRSGVLWGDEVQELMQHANENNYALPAVNVIGSNSINAVLETAGIIERGTKSRNYGFCCRSASCSYVGRGLWGSGYFAYRPLR